ncbi:MAG TPA: hypothetical protein VGI66_06860 [Streptosporangiaceae bacterium]|jgi:MoxR-like ATPase
MLSLTRVHRCEGTGAEFETVLGLLDGTQLGQGRVLLEGEPGT